ncbi:MAG: DNA polymerase III subunit gamma/tau [Acidobacteria bacterium]|nr:DNA polymerase III subunit gamma/tau [Acidobacteriota bacterium]
MSYQVLARKYRPQAFDEVVGQRGTTETLRNAIASGRIAHSFIFSGARGVGKTTTARILAKALNCVTGPTPVPCGACDACTEIAEGRDLDVVEIDAATHTGVDNVREVIIENLSIRPVRDRYKIFIIDEVHMLSASSFNALLKSVEEPPDHVVFMMATTELHKIPDTIRSRSQEYEFRTIATRDIVAQLQKIAGLEGIGVEPAALQMMARAAEGSLRDAESAFDQVIAFAGEQVTADDVATVLGIVGRDLLLDIVEMVADEDAPKVFDLAGRAVESGHDLRLLCRELSRVVRDMMVVSIDPSRLDDPEYVPEGDVERLKQLASRYSREDLLRAFDVIARAEFDLRNASQPRYTFEMTLLKWMHLRSVAPLADVIAALQAGQPVPPRGAPAPRRHTPAPGTRSGVAPAFSKATAGGPRAPIPFGRPGSPDSQGQPRATPLPPAPTPPAPTLVEPVPSAPARASADEAAPHEAAPVEAAPDEGSGGAPGPALRDRILTELKKTNKLFHGAVAAQAHRVEVDGDRLTFTFTTSQRVLRAQLEQKTSFIERVAEQVAGHPMKVLVVEVEERAAPKGPTPAELAQERLRQAALADGAVQALLDVFPAEIKNVEEIEE